MADFSDFYPPHAEGIVEAPIDGTKYGRMDADWVSIEGGGGLTYESVAVNTVAAANYGYFVDSASSPITITLPAGVDNDVVTVRGSGNAETNNVIIVPNGADTIMGDVDGFTLNVNWQGIKLVKLGTDWEFAKGIGEGSTGSDGGLTPEQLEILANADAGNIGKTIIAPALTDINVLLPTGMFFVLDTATGAPTTNFGVLHSITADSVTGSQTFTSLVSGTPRTYMRSMAGSGGWSLWNEVFTSQTRTSEQANTILDNANAGNIGESSATGLQDWHELVNRNGFMQGNGVDAINFPVSTRYSPVMTLSRNAGAAQAKLSIDITTGIPYTTATNDEGVTWNDRTIAISPPNALDEGHRRANTWGGAGIFASMFGDIPQSGIVYAVEAGTTNYITWHSYKAGNDSPPVNTVIASSVLTLGSTNAGGTINVLGFTSDADGDNVRMYSKIQRVY